MQPITVLHLINGFADASIERIILNFVTHLGTQEYRWHVLGLTGGTLLPEFEKAGAVAVDLSLPENAALSPTAFIRRYLQQHPADILHTHTIKSILLGARACAGQQKSPFHIATKHILTRPSERRHGLFYAAADRLALYLPNHLVAVSDFMRAQILALPGIQEAKVTTIRNAIHTQAYHSPYLRADCRTAWGIAPTATAIGFMGRIVQAKRIDILLTSFAAFHQTHPDSVLVLAGDGDQRPALQALAHSLQIAEFVRWLGFVQDIPRMLAGLDIFVQPSVNEGLSLSLLEALAAGKAVVATDVGGTAEVLDQNRNGLLIPAGSPQALTAALAQLADQPDQAADMARSGRAYVEHHFNLQQMISSYDRLYRAAASPNGFAQPAAQFPPRTTS